MILFLDTETFCETPIRNGTHRYAEDVEIMLWAWAIDDGEPQVWDATTGGKMPEELKQAIKSAETIVFHNSTFDRTVIRHATGYAIEPERIHDTMVQALSHGLPGGLDKLGEIFALGDKSKDKAGRQLIQLFCRPPLKNSKRGRATRLTHPAEWEKFKAYAKADIPPMRELFRKIPKWNYAQGNDGHRLWVLDQRINDRGYKVDQELAAAAVRTVERHKKILDKRTQELTEDEIRSTTQRDEILKHLLAEYGVTLPDLQSGTIERRLEDPDLPPAVKELLANRLIASTTTASKYNTLLKAVSRDGRLRGTLQFCGAPRTKRWSGKVFQPQNLIRPAPWFDAEEQERAIGVMKADAAHLIYDEPIEVANYAVRGCIVADEGKKLVVSDLEQIEARTLPWLAGEEWKLQAFRDYDAGEGADIYRVTAGKILGKDPFAVSKDERQAYGKVVELACGYGGAHGAFMQFARIYGVDLPDREIYQIVRDWRGEHPALCDWDHGFWAKLDAAAREAIQNPGRICQAGEHIAFERWRNWLKMHLPSGGFLSYAAPAIAEDPRRPRASVCFMGMNQYTRKWERIFTYGGKLSADATQATAREVMASNLPEIEEAGYEIELLVHDECVTETPDDVNYSVDKLNTMMARNKPWNRGLPIAAAGFEARRYRKE